MANKLNVKNSIMSYTYKYPMPSVTADILVLKKTGVTSQILLIKRRNEPFKDCWAFPGGFTEEGETLEQSASRELLEETGLGNHPVVIRTLSGIGRTISEDISAGGMPSPAVSKA